MGKSLENFVRRLAAVESWIVIPMFMVMLALMFIQVIYRYLLEIPLPWSEELCRYLFIVSTFLGGAIATAERSHIEINFVDLAITKSTADPSKRIKRGLVMNIFRDVLTTWIPARSSALVKRFAK